MAFLKEFAAGDFVAQQQGLNRLRSKVCQRYRPCPHEVTHVVVGLVSIRPGWLSFNGVALSPSILY